MAINKNFVVKNGLEVSTDLILADADRNKVGIGSTTPRTELDVRGGIAATDLNISGVATIATLRAVTGIVTDLLATNVTAGLGTFNAIQVTDFTSSGISTAASLNVTGIATIAVGIVTNLSGTNLNYSGISTIQNGQITTLDSTSVRTSNFYATGVSTITSLSVTGSTFDTLTVNNFSTLNGVTTVTNARVTNLNVSGVSTLGTVQISSGVVTATSGVVTYYGDASYLTGNARNLTATIGVGTTGGVVGYGISFINFYGTGVSTAYYNSSAGIATIFFEGGGSGTIGIGTAFPPSGNANGDLFYHANYGKLFVYYDETIIGVGTDAYWVDAAPSNVGIITGLTNVSFYPGSASSPSIYIIGDSQTGLFSPSLGNITFVSTGSSVLNINPNGIHVTGIVTSTSISTGNINSSGIITSTSISTGNINSSGIITSTSISTGNINSSGIVTSTSISTGNINSSGIITAFDFDALSDVRYKENINTVESALSKVDQLRGVKFDWKESGLPSYGVIAQELEEVLPELVHGHDPKTVNYNGIIGVLIEAIKELKQEIEILKSDK